MAKVSRVLAASWFVLVGLALAGGLAVWLIPNELNEHIPVFWYLVGAVLAIAVFTLPLLVAAAVLDWWHKKCRSRAASCSGG
jgi:hypothetical protein